MKKHCINCKSIFHKKPNESISYWATKKYCSHRCHSLSQKGKIAWNKDLNLNLRICVCGNKKFYSAKECRECYQKTHIPWNKDKKTGQKAWNKGKTLSDDYREKLSKAHIGLNGGENNHAWKGGITPINKSLRILFAKHFRKVILKRDNYSCSLCGVRGGYLHVDHIVRWSESEDTRFSTDNCRTLCRDCHYQVTYNKKMPANSRWGILAGGII